MTELIAHRGLNRLALENTLPAFELAVAHGMRGVELDTQIAACGTPVVFHDTTLERLFGIKRAVSELRAEELRALRPIDAARFEVDAAQMGIPTLREVLARLPTDDFLVNIEIKCPKMKRKSPSTPVFDLLDEVAGRREVLISCFHPAELARIARRTLRYPLGFLYDIDTPMMLHTGWPTRLLSMVGLRAIHPNWQLVSPWLVKWAHERGLEVNVWTVNDPLTLRILERYGVDRIITDAITPQVEHDTPRLV